jgi:hypothetical protein
MEEQGSMGPGGGVEGGQEPPQATPAPAEAPGWMSEMQQTFANQLAELGQRFEQRMDDRLPPPVEEPGEDGGLYDEFPPPGEDDPEVVAADRRFEEMWGDDGEPDRELEQLRNGHDQLRAEVAEIRQERVDRAFSDLEAEFPALQDPKVAEPVLRAAFNAAREVGDPRLAESPAFIRLT